MKQFTIIVSIVRTVLIIAATVVLVMTKEGVGQEVMFGFWTVTNASVFVVHEMYKLSVWLVKQ